jgi:hypothetical protein
MLAETGGDVTQIPPGKDGWHSRESLAAWLAPHVGQPAEVVQASFANIERPGSWSLTTNAPPASPRPSMTPDEAFATGRVTARSRPDWEVRFARHPESVGETLASLAPVLANAGSLPTPLTAAEELDLIDEQLYGVGHSEASRQRQRDRQDMEALEQHRDVVAQEQVAANDKVTPDEWRAIYGTEPPDGL